MADTLPTVGTEIPTILTSNVKLPYDELTLCKGDSKTITIVAGNEDYQFDDVTTIEMDGTSANVTFTRVSNRSFKLTAIDSTQDETIIILVKKSDTEKVELLMSITVKEEHETVRADFNKAVIDICPGAVVDATFQGPDVADMNIDGVVDSTSPLSIDPITREIRCNREGYYTNGLIISKDGVTRIVYIQAHCQNIIKVTPTFIEIHQEQTATIDIELKGSDYNMTIDNTNVATADKLNKTVTPVSIGECTLSVSGTRGLLTQTVNIPVSVRAVIVPRLPKLLTSTTEVKGGSKIQLLFQTTGDDRLSAELAEPEGDENGRIIVEGNAITYYAPTPVNDMNMGIKVRTTSIDGLISDWLIVNIRVLGKPLTALTVPQQLTVKEKEEKSLGIETSASTISIVCSNTDYATVNASRRTITGKMFGTVKVFITAEAIDHLPISKEISVTVAAADVNRPMLRSRVLKMVEEEDIILDFIVDQNCILEVEQIEGLGTILIEGHKCIWTAPVIEGNVPNRIYKFKAYAIRPDAGKRSELPYEFSIVVEKKEVEDPGNPDQPTEPVDTGLPYSKVQEVIKDSQLTFTEKMNILSTQGNEATRVLINKLLSYKETMTDDNKGLKPAEGAAKNFELYMVLLRVIESKDNTTFQALFDVVNMVFKEWKDDAYSEFKMHRFDDLWSGGDKGLLSFQYLTTAISNCCDILTREAAVKRTDFNILFDPEKTIFTERTKQSIVKYYTV